MNCSLLNLNNLNWTVPRNVLEARSAHMGKKIKNLVNGNRSASHEFNPLQDCILQSAAAAPEYTAPTPAPEFQTARLQFRKVLQRNKKKNSDITSLRLEESNMFMQITHNLCCSAVFGCIAGTRSS